MSFDKRVEALGIELPTKVPPRSGVVPCVEDGGTLYVSGHGPEDNEGRLLYRGRVGAEVSLDDGYRAARAAGVQVLRAVRDHLGTLDRVDRILKVLVLVNSADDFHDQPAVAHGCSDLFVEVFGERGRHARSAIGTSNLPLNKPVEIEAVLRFH